MSEGGGWVGGRVFAWEVHPSRKDTVLLKVQKKVRTAMSMFVFVS